MVHSLPDDEAFALSKAIKFLDRACISLLRVAIIESRIQHSLLVLLLIELLCPDLFLLHCFPNLLQLVAPIILVVLFKTILIVLILVVVIILIVLHLGLLALGSRPLPLYLGVFQVLLHLLYHVCRTQQLLLTS
mmetsp:Transcript_10203/g.10169  ORF Transcript_10203/g.10169 Transcript_10203/m.10169 type:complete len:134 (+) Transcript_10203:213-614(+)